MPNRLFHKYFGFFLSSSRLDKAKKNIFALFILHSFNLVLTLLLVPITLKCLTTTEYGIWLTLTSITAWFISLDFGLGNGLRNKLAEALALKDIKLAKIYTSTTYAYLTVFVSFFYLIFLLINPFLNWTKILNAPPELSQSLNTLVFIVFTIFILNFILKLIIIIPIADQKPALNGFFTLLINLSTVSAIYLLSRSDFANLLNLGTISSVIPAMIYLGASIILFSVKYREIKPSLKHIKSKYSRHLLTLGFRFFVIQIASLIIFATDNLIITQIFTPADVTIYNIAFKYFYILSLVFGVILTPFWSAYTEAYTKGDFGWIRIVNTKLIKIWLLFVAIVFLMLLIAPTAYRIWIGSEIIIPEVLSILMAIFAVITMWNNIFAYFLNGVGKIQLQLYNSVFVGILNIPLSIFFATYMNLGVSGVILATITCLFPSAIWAPLQYQKIINQTAIGIWNK